MLDAKHVQAVSAKRQYRQNLSVDDLNLGPLSDFETMGWTPDQTYKQFSTGTFSGIDKINLRWVTPDFFLFTPYSKQPFKFTRSDGSAIVPEQMFTDGGSIPRIFWIIRDLSPWGYAPAYLIHDWLFDLHHCDRTNLSFEEVRDIMMEAIKTLMENGLCPKSLSIFYYIYWSISSKIARDIWDRDSLGCPLP